MAIARAIDVGFGNTKYTCSSKGGDIKCGLFPSMSHWSTVDPTKELIGEKRDTVAVPVENMFHEVGPGIGAADQHTIFEKFRQVGDTLTAKPQGTGLGLPISRQIVERFGGRLWVTSEQGGGARFSFALPLDKDGAPRREEREAT